MLGLEYEHDESAQVVRLNTKFETITITPEGAINSTAGIDDRIIMQALSHIAKNAKQE